MDPDNRRWIDFDHRRDLLRRLDDGWQPQVDATGAAKLLVVSRALRVRAARALSEYSSAIAQGPAAAHLIGFDRGGVIALATRLPLRLAAAQGWGRPRSIYRLPTGRMRLPGPGTPEDPGWSPTCSTTTRSPSSSLSS
ncbi:MAG: hypothetical protein WKF47_07340 [Geodermatophilaceae bacterium]